MAYQFAQAPSHSYLRTANAPAFTAELAISLWFKAADVTNHHTLVKIEFDDPDNNRLMVTAMGNVAGDPVRFVSQSEGTAYTLDTTTSYSANVWQHVLVATGFSAGKMWISLNGAAWVANTSVKGPNGSPSYIQIGGDNVFVPSIIGSVAEVAVYNQPVGVLNASQRAALAQGFSPYILAPQYLIGYWRLIRELTDSVGGNHLTAYNSPAVSEHPPVIG